MKFLIFNFFNKWTFEVQDIVYDKYNLHELSIILNKKFKLKTEIKGQVMIATWTSNKTVIVLKYDNYGNYISKIDEYWK